jgi:hypothetical protein
MALRAKQPHIRVDQQIWDDQVMIQLSDRAFKIYIFGIAWSKCQNGRTRDGLLTEHGLGRIGATSEVVEELVTKKLFKKVTDGYEILKYDEWQVTSKEERDEAARLDERRENGRASAAKRWSRPLPVPEEGFEPEKAFELAWGEWPEDGYVENREHALQAFCENITNSKDWSAFQAAQQNRIKEYRSEKKPLAERRRWLGAFKNFCDERWRGYIPKNFRSEPTPAAPPVSKSDNSEGASPPTSPAVPEGWKPWEPEF